MEHDDLESLFRDKLENIEIPVSDGLWKRISTTLDNKPNPWKFSWNKISLLIISSTLILGFSLGILYHNSIHNSRTNLGNSSNRTSNNGSNIGSNIGLNNASPNTSNSRIDNTSPNLSACTSSHTPTNISRNTSISPSTNSSTNSSSHTPTNITPNTSVKTPTSITPTSTATIPKNENASGNLNSPIVNPNVKKGGTKGNNLASSNATNTQLSRKVNSQPSLANNPSTAAMPEGQLGKPKGESSVDLKSGNPSGSSQASVAMNNAIQSPENQTESQPQTQPQNKSTSQSQPQNPSLTQTQNPSLSLSQTQTQTQSQSQGQSQPLIDSTHLLIAQTTQPLIKDSTKVKKDTVALKKDTLPSTNSASANSNKENRLYVFVEGGTNLIFGNGFGTSQLPANQLAQLNAMVGIGHSLYKKFNLFVGILTSAISGNETYTTPKQFNPSNPSDTIDKVTQKAKYQYIGMPLNLEYEMKVSDNFTLVPYAGLQLNYFTMLSLNYYSSNANAIIKTENKSLNYFTTSGLIGTKLDYKIRNQWSLYLNANYNFLFNGVGVDVGLKRKF